MRKPSFRVLIPHRSDSSGYRDRNLDYVYRFWTHRFQRESVTVFDVDGDWNKPRGINLMVRQLARVDCTIIADSDCFIMDAALERAKNRFWGRVCLPHHRCCYLNEERSNDVVSVVDPKSRIGGRIYRRCRTRKPVDGGCWFVDTDLLLANPLDERFAGWGGDDVEFLARVPFQRLNGPIYHLFHPKAERRDVPEKLAMIEATRRREAETRRAFLYER